MYKLGAQSSGLSQSTDHHQSHSSGREGTQKVCRRRKCQGNVPGNNSITDRVRGGGGRLGSGEAVGAEAGETPGKEVSMEQMQQVCGLVGILESSHTEVFISSLH